jgi:general stress protein 26
MVNICYQRDQLPLLRSMPMLDVVNETGVGALLAGAAKTIQAVRYCWLVTRAADGGFNARPMGRILPEAGEDGWTMRFVTDGRSRKAHELCGARDVGLIFQSDPDEAYVALFGAARLLEAAGDVDRLWKKHYAVYFPTPADRAAAAFIEIDVDRMELWIRGVTPEPFGLNATKLARDASGEWKLGEPH